jgi:hypothetical protein
MAFAPHDDAHLRSVFLFCFVTPDRLAFRVLHSGDYPIYDFYSSLHCTQERYGRGYICTPVNGFFYEKKMAL